MGAHSVDFAPDASHLAVGGINGLVQVLLVENMTQIVAQVCSNRVYCIAAILYNILHSS